MDEQIKKAVKDSIGKEVVNVSPLVRGTYNKVFKLELKDGAHLIIRIFASKNWPEPGKLEWISKFLSENNVSTAKILFSTRNSEIFENGFMIQEFIDGDIVENSINKEFSFEDFYSKLGRLIRKVHNLPVRDFGYINNGRGNHLTLRAYLERDIELAIERIVDTNIPDAIDEKKVRAKVLNCLKFIDSEKPVLCHNDLSPKNVMLSNGELTLIDWDNGVFSHWIDDFSTMTYWMRWRHIDPAERQKMTDIFLKAYDNNVKYDDILEIEKSFHVLLSLNLMSFYYGRNKLKSYKDTMDYLSELTK